MSVNVQLKSVKNVLIINTFGIINKELQYDCNDNDDKDDYNYMGSFLRS